MIGSSISVDKDRRKKWRKILILILRFDEVVAKSHFFKLQKDFIK